MQEALTSFDIPMMDTAIRNGTGERQAQGIAGNGRAPRKGWLGTAEGWLLQQAQSELAQIRGRVRVRRVRFHSPDH